MDLNKQTNTTNEKGVILIDAAELGDYIFEGFLTEEVKNKVIKRKIRIITLLVKIK